MRYITMAAATACLVSATAASATEVSGTFAVDLTQLYAVEQTGSPAPEGDGMCNTVFRQYVGSTLAGSYDINTDTLIMSANATFLDSDVQLYPLGISGTWAFMSDGVPPALSDRQVDRIIANVAVDFESVEGDILFVTGGEYNCVLSNLAPNNM